MEPARADIKEAVDQVVEATTNPSNQDLHDDFIRHAIEDKTNFDSIHARLDTIEKNGAQILQIVKNVDAGKQFLLFGWNNSAKIGGVIVFILGAVVFFKVGIAGVIAFISGYRL